MMRKLSYNGREIGVNRSRKLYKLDTLQKERELLSVIRLGDMDKSLKIFKTIIVTHLKGEASDLTVVGARVLELLLLSSRAMVDAGAEYSVVTKINQNTIVAITKATNKGEIVDIAQETMRAYVNCRATKGSKSEEVIHRVKKYILENYSKQLTLEQIASKVYISPFYLCHLFKKIEGVSVIEFLTTVRIEKAKLLLKNPSFNICQISEKIGYKVPSYFTKVFRHKEGKTPTQYRKLG